MVLFIILYINFLRYLHNENIMVINTRHKYVYAFVVFVVCYYTINSFFLLFLFLFSCYTVGIRKSMYGM